MIAEEKDAAIPWLYGGDAQVLLFDTSVDWQRRLRDDGMVVSFLNDNYANIKNMARLTLASRVWINI